MDEATANVDNETDRILQNVIMETFKDSTLLVIAHRIRTIIESDIIMVIDNGVCKEFGSPHEIFHKEKSFFRDIILSTGKEESKFLISRLKNNS